MEDTTNHTNRVLILLGLLCAALLGGLLASIFAPEPVQAAPLQSFGAQIKLTALGVPNTSLANFTNTLTKIGDIGAFTVENSVSLVEVTHQGRLYVASLTNATGAYFVLRVDDTSPLADTGLALIRSAETTTYVPSTFLGYWQNLATGQHTVSLWVRALQSGSGTNAWMNPGGFGSNDLLIKEYLPFGSNYMPVIQR